MGRYGTLPKDETLEQAFTRLMKKVTKTETCWVWKGGTWSTGYARFWYQGRAHIGSRFVYQYFHGPQGALHVLHKCDNPPCVRPEHLFAGTQKDNVEDCLKKNRWMSKKRREAYSIGEARYGTKLTEAQVADIRATYQKGGNLGYGGRTPFSFRALAEKYGVGMTTIVHIIQRKTWKHVI
jgi:hypothetical protein